MKKNTIILLNLIMLVLLTGTSNAQHITVTWGGTGSQGLSVDGHGAYLTNVTMPHDVCTDVAGNVYYIDLGNNLVRKISATNGVVITIAGGGISVADGVPATSAAITPSYMCIDNAYNIFITTGNKVRKIDAITGLITTVAGIGVAGYTGDGAAAIGATLNSPLGICIDEASNLYIVDSGNNCVRKVTAATGIISTIAGNGTGSYTGDSGPATAATLHCPTVICVNSAGDVYVADQCNLYTFMGEGMFLRKISASTGVITTISGTYDVSPSNLFGLPPRYVYLGHVTGICCDADGNIYCNEISCSCRKIDFNTDTVYAVAGNFLIESYSDGVNSLLANMDNPYGLCADAGGNVYVADHNNNRIRKIIQLTHTPAFAYRTAQTIFPCTGQAVSINQFMAISLIDSAQTETWSVITNPTHGSLSGFPFTMLSKGTDSLTIPIGLSYQSTSGYTGADFFMVRVSNGIVSDTMKIYVSVGTTSPVSITIPTSICTGAALPLTATVPGGSWSLTNTNTYMYDGFIYGYSNGLDTIIYNTSGECAATEVITINVSPSAGLVSGSSLVCIGANTTLIDGVSGGTWSTTGTAATINATTGVVTGISTGSEVILYSVSNALCTSTSPFSINVGIPIGIISGSPTLCTGVTFPYYETISGGSWSLSNGFATLAGTGTSISISGISAGLDTLNYIITNICGTASISRIISLNPTPAIPYTTGPSSLCVGSSATFTGSVSGGYWSTYSGYAYVDSFSGTNCSISGSSAGTDTVYYTLDVDGCTATSSEVLIVNDLPDAGVISGLATVHTGNSTLLSNTVLGGTWSTTNSSVSTVSGTGLVYGVEPGIDSVVYTVIGTSCTSSVYYTFTVTPVPASISMNTTRYETILIQPNPAKNQFAVNVITRFDEPVTITITNVTGMKVKEIQGTTNKSISTNINVPSGLYFIHAVTSEGIMTGKLIIE